MNLHEISGPINQDMLDFEEYPVIQAEEYRARIGRLLGMAKDDGLTAVIVYGDREHCANVHYLSGYDPRFEETLFLLKMEAVPKLIVGLEGDDYSKISPLEIDRRLYSGFGLQGQPATDNNIKDILMECGLKPDDKVGLIGWKTYPEGDYQHGELISDLPHYLVEAIAAITGRQGMKNITGYMSDNRSGLRTTLSVDEIVQAEYINAHASRQVYRALSSLQEGISEAEASEFFCINGFPMITYPAMSFGKENVSLGLASVQHDKQLRTGDAVSIGLGYRHAMVHRSAFYVRDKEEFLQYLGAGELEFYESYYKMLSTWYGQIQIGKKGGEVYRAIESYIEPMGIKLNAGHQIHTEEWTNSLFFKDSPCEIQSGMAIQCDIIASSQSPYITAHVEDGLIVADADLQARIEARAPRCFARMQERRAFMKDVLHIPIANEVLPLSDIQGMLFIFMADHKTILTNR